MSEVKAKMMKIIESQPEDASYGEILRELAFEILVDRGLEDTREGRVISNEKMKLRIQSWQKRSPK